MARRIAIATGNWTAAGTWAVSDATALLDSEAANTALTAAYVTSSTFTPGAITIDGIAIKIASRAAGSPSNTISVALDLATVTVAGTEVTINVSDINECSTTQNEGGWYFFKFPAPVLLLAATAYGVKVKLSDTSTAVNLYSSATTNWSRQLRTTTTGAPGAADVLDVIGEHTGAGTGNSFTVTMNSVATTDYGAGTDNIMALGIGKRGTLTYGTTATTNYYLKLSGDLIVFSGGALNVGTSGTPMPNDSTAVLEFDPVADGGMGLRCRNGSTVNMRGKTITTTQTVLTADEAAAQTVLSVGDTTDWETGAGKDIGIASTTRTPGETEVREIASVDSAVQVTVTSGLTNAHGGGGTALVIAEVVYLYRNVIVRSATSTLMTYINIKPTANVDCRYVLFRYLGENATPKRGIEIETTTGTVVFTHCVLRDCEDQAVIITTVTGSITFTDSIFYDCNSSASNITVFTATATSGIHTITNNWIVGGGGTSAVSAAFTANDAGSNYAGCRVAGYATAIANSTFVLSEVAAYVQIDNIVIHSGSGTGIQLLGTHTFCQNLLVYRMQNNGWVNSSTGTWDFRSCTWFGNQFRNIALNSANGGMSIFSSCTTRSDATFSASIGISVTVGIGKPVYFLNCSFSQGVAHAFDFEVTAVVLAQIIVINPVGSITVSTNFVTNATPGSYISVQKANGVADVHKSFQKYGTVFSESVIQHTASGIAWKMTPSNASNKMRIMGPTELETFKAPVSSGVLVTLSAWVRKSAAYNGNAPRLVVVGGLLGGVGSWATDITDSLTVAADTWEQLQVTFTPSEQGVAEWYVDCDGTAGDVFVDDMSVVQ